MIGIYKITNPEKEIYIGQSTNIEKRFETYKKHYCKEQTKLYESLKKYGWFYHSFEIIEECKEEELNKKEQYWIKQYNCVLNGMNCIGGGYHKPYIYPEEAKRIKSEKMKKLWMENKFKRKLGKRIQNIKTGEIYESCSEAANKLNISLSTIAIWCKKEKNIRYIDNWNIRPSKFEMAKINY
jgi:group I intron endonuclease